MHPRAHLHVEDPAMPAVSSSRPWWLNAAAAALMLSFASGCDNAGSNTGTGEEFSIQVGLINGDALIGNPIHLFAPGETFPCCRVNQLETRNVTLTVKSGQKVTFQAGRSGTVLKSVQCTVNGAAGKIVRWTPTSAGSDNGSLTCHTGW
jgi:hypothetical protein